MGAGYWTQSSALDAALVSPDATGPAARRARGATVIELRLARADGPATASAHVVFEDGAAPALDGADAFALVPPAGDRLQLVSALDDGTALSVDVRPAPADGRTEIELYASALSDSASTVPVVLSWPRLDAVPAEWSLMLVDRVTGARTDLRTTETYAFSAATETDGRARRSTAAPLPEVHRVDRSETARSGAGRFALVVGLARPTDAPESPGGLLVAAAYPNPFRERATLPYALSVAAEVTLEVYDVIGRRVVSERQSAAAGGGHRFEVAASGLAAGSYLYRLVAATGGRTETAGGRLTLR